MSSARAAAASPPVDSRGSGELQAGWPRWEGRRTATHGLGSLKSVPCNDYSHL